MLIALPIGLWVFSLVSDLIAMFTGHGVWRDVAFYTLAGGTVSALGAAIPGIIDYTGIRDKRAGSTATWHAIFNVAALVIFGADWYLRTGDGMPHTGGSYTIPLALSIVGNILIGVSGWLGGELVYVHGVAVAPEPTERPGTPARQ
jgi:uncharacterized membrane protein